MISINPVTRLNQIIDLSWAILFERIVSKKLIINKESSLQLHFSKLIFDIGTCYCILPGEIFEIEMETRYEKKSIDVVCNLGLTRAAIELKCFIKSSNRATDLDCYDSLRDIERLHNYSGFDIKRFICLTDNNYYPETNQKGHGKSVSIINGTTYLANVEILPSWAGQWKVGRDAPIVFKSDVYCNWINSDKWHYWVVDC